MSGIFLFAPLLAMIGAFLIWVIMRPFYKRWSTLAAVVAFPILAVACFVILPQLTSSSGFNATAAEANANLATFSVPDQATTVNFQHDYLSGTVDAAEFSIGESLFLDWMSKNGWSPTKFVTNGDAIQWLEGSTSNLPDRVWVLPLAGIRDDTEYLDVRNGYYLVDDGEFEDDDSFFRVIFDADKNRAYAEMVTF